MFETVFRRRSTFAGPQEARAEEVSEGGVTNGGRGSNGT